MISAVQRALPGPRDGPGLAVALILSLPLAAALVFGALFGGGEAWANIVETKLVQYLATTLGVLLITAVLILAAAIPSAWLVTMYEFPGRRLFEWLLILPLAAPGYVLAFAYADLLGVGGPVQSALRAATGLTAREYWFPEIKSLAGCGFVLAAALFPYVYLTARAAFTTQSVCALEAARSLGASARSAFFRVALPGARAGVAAGLALALMEAAADYGAADFLGVPTLTVGVFRAWGGFGDAAAAARLAILLVALALSLQWIERRSRGRAGNQATSARWRTLSRVPLHGPSAIAATALCATVFAWGFAAPVGRLIWIALETTPSAPPIGRAFVNSLSLAGLGAGAAFILALVVALSSRAPGPAAHVARAAASAGYAAPGAVMALGALAIVAALGTGLTTPIALGFLVWVYASRFTAAGSAPMEAALGRAPASVPAAASSLGAGPVRRALQVDLPIALPGAAAGALILFVETLKELPATLMLRPFDWDTLAVKAYAYASDERLAAAALPSLLITLAGLAPVLLLSWGLSRGRAGGRAA